MGFSFWWRWVLLTIFGRAVGFIVGFVLGHIVLGNVSIGIGEGAIVGLCQWLLLKRYIPRSAKWILFSVIGLFVPLGLYGAAWYIWRISMDLSWPMGGLGWAGAYLVGGAFMGWMQLSILRRRVPRPEQWIYYSALGWCLSIVPMMIRADMTGDLPIPLLILRNGMMSPAFAGLVLGAITGWGLMKLQRQKARSEQA
jgi:hypothetical protein